MLMTGNKNAEAVLDNMIRMETMKPIFTSNNQVTRDDASRNEDLCRNANMTTMRNWCVKLMAKDPRYELFWTGRDMTMFQSREFPAFLNVCGLHKLKNIHKMILDSPTAAITLYAPCNGGYCSLDFMSLLKMFLSHELPDILRCEDGFVKELSKELMIDKVSLMKTYYYSSKHITPTPFSF
jgi:hypothetical protein